MRRASIRALSLIVALATALFVSSSDIVGAPKHRSTRLELDSLSVRAVIAGKGDTTLLLIHGYGESLMAWRPTFDGLARRYRVVAFDLPGFGASDKPAGPYTLDRMVSWVAEVAHRTMGESSTLILLGHSMGGEIAAALANAQPDLVQAMVLIAPAGFGIGLGGLVDSVSDQKARLIGWYQAARAFILPIHDPGWLEEGDGLAGYDLTLDPRYRASTASVLEHFDFEALAASPGTIQPPTLLVWGRLDPVVPVRLAQEVADHFECVRLAFFDEAMHRPQVEHPEVFLSRILPFLRQPDCAAGVS